MDFHSSFRFVLTHHAMSLVVRPSVAVVKSPFVATEQTSSPFRLSATAVTAALLSPFLRVSPGAPVLVPHWVKRSIYALPGGTKRKNETR